MLDASEIIKRLVKYLIEGLIVAIVSYVLLKKGSSLEQTIIIGLVAAASFALLDTFAPSISAATKSGVGLALGTGIGGGIMVA